MTDTGFDPEMQELLHALLEDQKNIGTQRYKGIAFFGWNKAYKHKLRQATPEQRQAIHNSLLAAGLSLDGKSNQHRNIIGTVTSKTVEKPSVEDMEIVSTLTCTRCGKQESMTDRGYFSQHTGDFFYDEGWTCLVNHNRYHDNRKVFCEECSNNCGIVGP